MCLKYSIQKAFKEQLKREVMPFTKWFFVFSTYSLWLHVKTLLFSLRFRASMAFCDRRRSNPSLEHIAPTRRISNQSLKANKYTLKKRQSISLRGHYIPKVIEQRVSFASCSFQWRYRLFVTADTDRGVVEGSPSAQENHFHTKKYHFLHLAGCVWKAVTTVTVHLKVKRQ